MLAQVLLDVGDDEVGAEIPDDFQLGILLAADAYLVGHALGGLRAVDGAPGHRFAHAEGEEHLGDAGDERDDAARRH